MDHVRGAPNHPQTKGKIERYHRSMKNVVKLEHYYSPGQLKQRLAKFVNYYNNHRYHESIQNVTPADVYFGRDKQILKKRNIMKQKTMHKRRKLYLLNYSKVWLNFILDYSTLVWRLTDQKNGHVLSDPEAMNLWGREYEPGWAPKF